MQASDALSKIDAEIAEVERLVKEKEREAAMLNDGAAVLAQERLREIRVVLDRLKFDRAAVEQSKRRAAEC
jgi:hypothetical protein